MQNSGKFQIVSYSGASNTGKYTDDNARMLSDFGIIKGKTPVTEEKENEIVEHINNLA